MVTAASSQPKVVCTLVITVAIPKIHGTGHMAHFAGNLPENHSGVRLLHFTYAGCGHNSFRRARHTAGPIKTISHKTLDGDVRSRKHTLEAAEKSVPGAVLGIIKQNKTNSETAGCCR